MTNVTTLGALEVLIDKTMYTAQGWFNKNKVNNVETPLFLKLSVSEGVYLSGCAIYSLRDIPRPWQVFKALIRFFGGTGDVVYIDIPMSDAVWVIEPHEVI